ncbi:helicase-primase subunit [Gallid alphaherpesvirus 1]|uniref:Helicase-primase subunit n=1 Tax=Infectious laryngotracheitis virus TaxID=10386 RepID=G8HKF5_ILTV|nr:helicase-primase subunit [Gallid alphaherpesvirus 1]AER28082.1 helicase-primase subunit [Gallid alphaherpesvirus 1]AER28161.1 helicase-primase subunit [Gallid alphaherpesvirus 1]AFN02038.1 helicase-primase subunit [Gallid alphaherpesvirus 1]QGA87044.1 helicase-primase subunit [Gallid alphaherpesvirus 1]QHW06106.1 helicase-primase subunit [Gallid alphaherpesvirus 1]
MYDESILYGYLWGISIYTIETKQNTSGNITDMWVLYELAVHDSTKGVHEVLYASLQFEESDLSVASWPHPALNARLLTDFVGAVKNFHQRVYKLNAKTINFGWILSCSTSSQIALRLVTGRLLHEIRRALTLPEFYSPSIFYVCKDSGLITKVCEDKSKPRMATASYAALNASSNFQANYIERNLQAGHCCELRNFGWARIQAISSGKINPRSMTAEWVWAGGKWIDGRGNEASSETGTDHTSEDGLAVPFALTPAKTIYGPTWFVPRRMLVASLVPKEFEYAIYLKDGSTIISLVCAIINLYCRFYQGNIVAQSTFLKPIILFLFPTSSSRMDGSEKVSSIKDSYMYTPGFPSINFVPITTQNMSKMGALNACRIVSLVEGLWPAYNIRALLMLDRGDRAKHGSQITTLPRDLESTLEVYPAGKISTIADLPTVISGRILKMDFSAFFPCLYMACGGGSQALCRIIEARLNREPQSEKLKAALVALVGGLKYTDPSKYKLVIALCNSIALAVENAANSLQFGIAIYMKDGFIGAFDKHSSTSAEELRSKCEGAAIEELQKILLECGQAITGMPTLKLRLEGEFTEGLLLNCNKYWLHNRNTGKSFICGIPGLREENGLSVLTERTACELLAGIYTANTVSTATETLTRILDGYAFSAFEARGDINFWQETLKSSFTPCISDSAAIRSASFMTRPDELEGETHFVYLTPTNLSSHGSANAGGKVIYPSSLAEENFCIKICYSAHLIPKMSAMVELVQNMVWLKFYHNSVDNDEETRGKLLKTCDYDYERTSFLFS